MVVATMAQLIVQLAILDQDATYRSSLYKELEGTVNGSAPNSREVLPQPFGGKVPLLGGNGIRHCQARRRGPVSFLF